MNESLDAATPRCASVALGSSQAASASASTAAASGGVVEAAAATLDPLSNAASHRQPLRVLTHVAGVRHYLTARRAPIDDTAPAAAASSTRVPIASQLLPGQTLIAEREPTNPRDPHAVRLMLEATKTDAETGEASTTLSPVGHLPASLARFLSPLLARQFVTAHVSIASAEETAAPCASSRDDETDAVSPSAMVLTSPRARSVEKVSIVLRIEPIQDSLPAVWDTATESLWSSLSEQINFQSASAALTNDQRVVANFSLVVNSALQHFPHIFTPAEADSVHSLLALPFDGQRLFVRLFSRTRPQRWFQLSALKYDAVAVRLGVSQLQCSAATAQECHTAPVDADLTMPLPMRSVSEPLPIAGDEDEMKQPHADIAAAEPVNSPFLSRASTLSDEDWSQALPSLLHECTQPMVKELISALGLSKLLTTQASHAKSALLQHLTQQRTLFASSMLRCNTTRRVVLSVCGDFVQLRPDFLMLCQRLHRIFFLQEDPTLPSPMLMENIGISRFHKSASARMQTAAAGQNIAAASTASAASASSSSVSATSSWSLFPTRECFISYDLAMQFFLQMHLVCENVLATGEARKADQTYSSAQAISMLHEARRRLDLEVAIPFSTHWFDAGATALAATQVSAVTGKARNAASFASLFGKASASPVAAAASPKVAGGVSAATVAAVAAFVPCDPRHPSAQRFFDSSVSGEHAFARPFRAAWVYAQACHYGARVLEREKRFEEANELYMHLLASPLAVHRRGAWWNRLALNLETHCKARSQALRVCMLGLQDASVRSGDLHELRCRSLRLWKHKDGGNAKPPCPVAGADAMPDYGRVRAVKDMAGDRSSKGKASKGSRRNSGSATPELVSPRKQALIDDSGYSSILLPDGVRLTTLRASPQGYMDGEHSRFFSDSNAAVRVEEMAKECYAREEYGSYEGLHDEGMVFHALFALLCFDVIFADVPDVFHTQYHDAPLDLLTDAFYSRRAALIHDTLHRIRTAPSLSLLLQQAWEAHHGVRVRGLNWRNTDLSLEQLQSIAECMGGEALAFVCDTIARDYAGWSGGLPDLFLWRPGAKPSYAGTMEDPAAMPKDLSTTAVPAVTQGARISIDVEMAARGPSPLVTPPRSTAVTPTVASSAAAVSPRVSAPADVICLSSGSDSDSDAYCKPAPLPRRQLSMPEERSAQRLKKPPLVAAASMPIKPTPLLSARKRTSGGAASSSSSGVKRAKSSASASASAGGSSSGTQSSLHAFTAVSPRFAVPRPVVSPFRVATLSTHLSVDSDDDSDAVECLGSSIPARANSRVPPDASSAPASWPSWKVVEVKGPGDRLSPQQVAWLAQLARCAACHAEVCYVLSTEQVARLQTDADE